MLQNWLKISSELIFSHKWYRLRKDTVQLPGGKIMDDYFVSERPDVIAVFALTENQEVVCVRQYKHASASIVLELPAGVIEKDEDPQVAAARELLEETGYMSESLTPTGKLWENPTKDTNRCYHFYAYNAKKVAEQNLDVSENIEVVLIPLSELPGYIHRGEIEVSNTIAGIFLGIQHINEPLKKN
jgi:ADP-ribose pyrophosphatase